MNEVKELNAEKRLVSGTGNSRLNRKEGYIPAIIYGEKKDPILITIESKIIKKLITQPGFFSNQFDLKVGKDVYRVLPKDLQLHPVKETIVHLDFLRIGENTKVVVSIPVKFINENLCPGLKTGGVINIVRHEIEVKSPVNKIPQTFEIDLNGLEIGDSIHISNVDLDKEVKPIISDRDFTIATIAPPTVVAVEEKPTEEETEEKTEETQASSKDEKTDDTNEKKE